VHDIRGQGQSNSISELDVALLLKKGSNIVRKIESLPKVMGFLDSIGRNSESSENTYSSGLALLQSYLDSEAFQQQYQGIHKCDCETILEPLSENKINVYEFLNGYVSQARGLLT
jgi:hypothetical protein